MKKEMLINVSQPEECRIAIVEDGTLEELYIERASQENYVGNIYRGRVVNIEPSIQAAFVDFGVGRNGFLHVSDLEPQYFRQGGIDPARAMEDSFESRRNGSDARGSHDADDDEDGDDDGDSRPQRRPRGPRPGARPRIKPPIQDVLRRGDEVLVQVIKEGIGAKGPTLSTYISIPGRYLVLMPALGRVGVSRKIEDDDARRTLRGIMLDLKPPKGLGFIVRTAGVDRTKLELGRDMAYLLRLWKVIVRRLKNSDAPGGVYEESDMIIRTIRDIVTGDVDAIYIDEPQAFERAREFLEIVMPRFVSKLQLYDGREPLFHRYGIDDAIARIHQRVVPLPQGGSIVIDQTEALVAIDVNSGSFRAQDSAEETAYQMNLQAAKEIARQLRLRDLGGVIVNDFIDMRRERYRRNVERCLRDAVRRDRARTKILRTSPFGLIEMTRQRIRPSLKRSMYRECPACSGVGVVKTVESLALETVRSLVLASHMDGAARVGVTVANDVATYLNNRKRRDLAQVEDDAGVAIQIFGRDDVMPEHVAIEVFNAEGRELRFPPAGSRPPDGRSVSSRASGDRGGAERGPPPDRR
jgi:ribonuclease E